MIPKDNRKAVKLSRAPKLLYGVAPLRWCGKLKHPSREFADRVIRRMREKPGCYDPETLNAYWCGKCQAYHVGHSRYDQGRT